MPTPLGPGDEQLQAALAGRYRLVGRLGQGGMATVYEARDERYDRRVAIKVMRVDLTSELGAERFLREIQITAQLNHANVLPLLDSGTAMARPYYVMPLVDGESLRQLLDREQRLPLGTALSITREVAEALSHAHALGIMHRDVKPENILLRGGHATVADFGIARAVDVAAGETLTRTGVAVGTPTYMSPEQASGTAPVDARTDVYALGAVLYEMLAGQPPFSGGTPLAVLASKAKPHRDIRTLRRDVPPEVEHAIARALAASADERFATVMELVAALGTGTAPRSRHARVALLAGTALATASLVSVLSLDVRGVRTSLVARLGSGPAAPMTLAVLPFENLGDASGDAGFQEGITAELVTKLSHVERLLVTGRSPVERFRGRGLDARQIGESLRVNYVLEGSIRQQGQRIRISAGLIDVRTGFRRWSQSFDHELRDVFVLQDEAAMRIVRALDLQLTPEERRAMTRRYTADVEAYAAYMQGRALIDAIEGRPADAERIDAAERAFRRALARDSTYALAISGLAQAEQLRYWAGVDTSTARIVKSDRLARQALAMDSSLGPAYVVIGDNHGVRGQWDSAVVAFRRGLRLDPTNAYGWEELAWALLQSRPPDLREAEHAAREAVRLSPGWFWAYYQLGDALRRQRRHAEALEYLRHALLLNPNFGSAAHLVGHVQLDRGEYREALAAFESDTAQGARAEVRWDLAAAHAGLGERDRAVLALLEAFARGYRDVSAIDTMPAFASIRDDPRVRELIRRHATP